MRADEPRRAGDKHRHPRPGRRPWRPPRRGGRVDLPLPVQTAPGRREILGRGVDEGLEAEVGRRHGDEEERPQEHGARRREASVQLPVHGATRPLDLDLPGGGGEEVVLQHPHLLGRRVAVHRSPTRDSKIPIQEPQNLSLFLTHADSSSATQPGRKQRCLRAARQEGPETQGIEPTALASRLSSD
uniref:Uncharacterized protein n=1 Tax=Arundo donax TaxID=35708 RepID=A0A0A9DYT0_ARUDO